MKLTIMKNYELKLSYAEPKYWWNRTLSVDSKEWKDLRRVILERDNWTCNFCGIRLAKYLIVDHIDGNATNNDLSNLRLNCPACDRIRHCGLAGLNKEVITGISQLSQLEIVRRTVECYLKTGKVVDPRVIDPNVTNLGLYLPIEVVEEEYKGFFTKKMKFSYLQFIVK